MAPERLKVNEQKGSIMMKSPAREQTNEAQRGQVVDVPCAFCGGKGKDPFGIMSPLSTCEVCGGSGRQSLHQPTAPCAFCRGTGVHPDSRLTCTACGGVGTVEVPANAVPCLVCGGSGRAPAGGGHFHCARCSGKGVIGIEPSQGRQAA